MLDSTTPDPSQSNFYYADAVELFGQSDRRGRT